MGTGRSMRGSVPRPGGGNNSPRPPCFRFAASLLQQDRVNGKIMPRKKTRTEKVRKSRLSTLRAPGRRRKPGRRA